MSEKKADRGDRGVVAGMRVLQAPMDRVRHPERLRPRALQLHVRAPHQLGREVPALALGERDVRVDLLRRLGEVAAAQPDNDVRDTPRLARLA